MSTKKKPKETPCHKCGDDQVYCWTCGEREIACECKDGPNLGDCTECCDPKKGGGKEKTNG